MKTTYSVKLEDLRTSEKVEMAADVPSSKEAILAVVYNRVKKALGKEKGREHIWWLRTCSEAEVVDNLATQFRVRIISVEKVK